MANLYSATTKTFFLLVVVAFGNVKQINTPSPENHTANITNPTVETVELVVDDCVFFSIRIIFYGLHRLKQKQVSMYHARTLHSI